MAEQTSDQGIPILFHNRTEDWGEKHFVRCPAEDGIGDSVLNSIDSNHLRHEPEFSVQVNEAKTVWSAYFRGQLANVAKAALWWSTFGILTASMLRSDIALAVTRGSFNLALLVSSPLAVAMTERIPIRRLLMVTTTGRLIIWSSLIPSAWIVFGLWLKWTATLWTVIIVLMFFDGVQVAFSNAVDIDCGGLDSLSMAYNLPLTDFLRYRFTTIHQLVFDSSFIFFTPPVILGLSWISIKLSPRLPSLPTLHKSSHDSWFIGVTGENASTIILALGVAFFFSVLSFLSLYFYKRGIPRAASTTTRSVTQTCAAWPLDSSLGEYSSPRQDSLVVAYRKKIQEVADGFIVVLSDKALKWRLILLATETALEDSMVSVIIPMIGLNTVFLLTGTMDNTFAALISVVTIAVGKLGGVLASVYLASHWDQDDIGVKSRKKLFLSVLLSSISLCLVPWGCWAGRRAVLAHDGVDLSSSSVIDKLKNPPLSVACVGMLIGVLLFFVFSTAPKIGFASLIQKAVSEDEREAMEVFGFVGMFVTVTDGLMIILINLIFSYLGRDRFDLALCVVTGIYLLHGLVEWHKGLSWIQERSG